MEKEISKIGKAMVDYFNGDIRRINHAMKVYFLCASIGAQEGLTDKAQKILEVAAILHDIGIPASEKKYGSSAGKYQEIEGPPIAEKMLKGFAFQEDLIERICYLIGNHHSYANINGLDFQILIEADFIVNIDEDGIGKEQIFNIREKYFQTKSGTEILNSMFSLK